MKPRRAPGVLLKDEEIVVRSLRSAARPARTARALPALDARSQLPSKSSRVLDLLLAPYTLTEFAELWGQKTLHIRRDGDPARFSHLLSLEMLDELLTARAIPEHAIVARKAHMAEREVLRRLPPTWLGDELASSESMSFALLEQFCPSLREVCDELEASLGLTPSVFAFLNPPNAKARERHWDPLDVFVLQLEGQKVWHIYEPRVHSPLARHDWQRYSVDTRKIARVVLRAGDTLYMPRGFIHEAESTNDMSLHITIGAFPLHLERLVGEARERSVRALRHHSAFRQPVPNVWDGTQRDWSTMLDGMLTLTQRMASPELLPECAFNEPRFFTTRGGPSRDDATRFTIPPGQLAAAYLSSDALARWTFRRTPAPFVLGRSGRSWRLAQRGYTAVLSSDEAACVRWIEAKQTFRVSELPIRFAKLDVPSLLWRMQAMGLLTGAAP